MLWISWFGGWSWRAGSSASCSMCRRPNSPPTSYRRRPSERQEYPRSSPDKPLGPRAGCPGRWWRGTIPSSRRFRTRRSSTEWRRSPEPRPLLSSLRAARTLSVASLWPRRRTRPAGSRAAGRLRPPRPLPIYPRPLNSLGGTVGLVSACGGGVSPRGLRRCHRLNSSLRRRWEAAPPRRPAVAGRGTQARKAGPSGPRHAADPTFCLTAYPIPLNISLS